jgi:hypothetical protein
MNFSIGFVIIWFTLFYWRKVKEAKDKILLLLFILIEILPISFLNLLGEPSGQFNSWSSEIRNLIRQNMSYQSVIGIFHGMVAVFIVIIGAKIAKKSRFDNDVKSYLRYIISVTSFFSVVVPLAIFSIQQPPMTTWALRPALLISGILTGILALAVGSSCEHSNSFTLYIGALYVFIIAVILGSLIIPITVVYETTFPAMLAFSTNLLLLCGVYAYFLTEMNSKLRGIIEALINKLI